MRTPDLGLGRHLISGLANRHPIATTPEERRVVARVVLEQGRRDHLLAFHCADTHNHLFAKCDAEAGARLLQRVESSLKQLLQLPVGFVQPYNEPVRSAGHQRSLFKYVLTQDGHHGLSWDPLHEASNLPDLLGLRVLGGYTRENVARWLPRVGAPQLLAWLGAPELVLRDGPLDRLAEATRLAAGLLRLDGKTPEAVAARRAALRVASQSPGVTISMKAEALGISRTAACTLRRGPFDPRLARAIQLQLGLMGQLADQGIALPCSKPPTRLVSGVG